MAEARAIRRAGVERRRVAVIAHLDNLHVLVSGQRGRDAETCCGRNSKRSGNLHPSKHVTLLVVLLGGSASFYVIACSPAHLPVDRRPDGMLERSRRTAGVTIRAAVSPVRCARGPFAEM